MKINYKPYSSATTSVYCSAVIISPRALLTSAHCIPANGWYSTAIEQQRVSGNNPATLFAGATWLNFTKHPHYLGRGHTAADLAVGTLYYTDHNFETSSAARIWMDSIPAGSTDFMLGYGSTYPGQYTGGHLHAGTGRIDFVYDYVTWTFPDTTPATTTCPGDSGGAHGAWHGNFMLYAVNSAGACGEPEARGSMFSIGTRMRYNMWFVEQVLGVCKSFTKNGQYYSRCW